MYELGSLLYSISQYSLLTRRLYCVERTQYSIHPKRSAICSRYFPGPTRVLDANGISITSAVFAGLTWRQTDWQTDRPRYSVGNSRRSAQWRSQILLVSMALNNRLDRSDQLQQSAAIFSCKPRRVAVYLETHCNISSKRAFPIGVIDRWHKTNKTSHSFKNCVIQRTSSSLTKFNIISNAFSATYYRHPRLFHSATMSGEDHILSSFLNTLDTLWTLTSSLEFYIKTFTDAVI